MKGSGILLLLALGLTAQASAASPEISARWDLPGRAKPTRIVSSDGRAFAITKPSAVDFVALDVIEREPTAAQAVPSLGVDGRLFDLALSRSQELDATTNLPLVRESIYLASSENDAELLIAAVPPGGPISIGGAIDLPGKANARAVAVTDGLVFVGRSSSGEQEFVILDHAGQILGGLHLPKRVDTIEVAGDVAVASNKRLQFQIDVSDPTSPLLVSTAITPRPADPPLNVKGTKDFVLDGPMAYLAVKKRDAEVQEVNLRMPLNFPDLDGDGFLTLGCAGDSNTAPVQGLTKWCERLAQLVDDPSFRVVNVSVAGSTAIPSPASAYDQVATLLDPALAIDAVVLSFGTNDTNLVHFAANPAVFESQLDEIAAHLEIHHATIEATGRRAYVATMPPRWKMLFGPNGFNERIIGLNERIQQAFPPEDIVDHYEFFYAGPIEIADGVHLTQRGQNKRAWRALVALTH